jgi:FAD/FMN-containing dehydrogenase
MSARTKLTLVNDVHSRLNTELYVPREKLADFLGAAREHLRASQANVIYGTVRLIERDTESALAWAHEAWACIIFNLHVDHTPAGIARAADQFRGLIDCALAFGGSYFLTYHRWATPEQTLAAHPALPAFIAHKRTIDPDGVFHSDWFRHVSGL